MGADPGLVVGVVTRPPAHCEAEERLEDEVDRRDRSGVARGRREELGGDVPHPAGVAGEAVAAAIERGTAGGRYPIGQENLSWAQLLGRLAREVYTIERIGALAAKARQTLSAAGVNNVKVRNADGREASSNVVQFDAIVVAAGGASIPPNLPGLLADGGRLVIPLGSPDHQKLTLVTRNGESFQQQAFDDVVFVPLKSGQE